MRRHTDYNVLDDENTGYSNYYELTYFPKAAGPHDQQKITEFDQAGGNRLQRFYFRTLVGILGPSTVCGYFVVIWRLYIDPIDKSEGPLTFGRRGATWIFYSWFVAGVIGLGLSLYGLAGVQASMLMEPTWNVRDATRLMLHAENTWSGPGGWLKTIKWSLNPLRRRGVRCRSPSSLWFILALPSILVFIAWPLSGLSLEITEGYYETHAMSFANMTGYSYNNFNERGTDEAYLDAAVKWSGAQARAIPGAGIAYTPEGYDRSKAAFLDKLPVRLPKDDGIPTLFLVAQADKPVQGNVWGLLLRYNCDIVHKAHDFQIIDKVHSSDSPWAENTFQRESDNFKLLKDKKSVVAWMNQADGSYASNHQAAIDIGFTLWQSTGEGLSMDIMLGLDSKDCYTNMPNATSDYPGIDQEQIFEIALWQRLRKGEISQNLSITPDYSIDHNITEYFGWYDARNLMNLSKEKYAKTKPKPMTAIGVQCRASSSVGSADVNGLKSTFSNFQRTDTPSQTIQNRCARRFGGATPYFMLSHWSLGYRWLSSLFKAAGAAPPYHGRTALPGKVADLILRKKIYDLRVQQSYLQAEQLRRAMLQAYASYASSLMFGDDVADATHNGSSLNFLNPNATEFASGQVIKPGVMPALVPLALFFVWALISSALGLTYGFRRRWAETLDGPTMFRLGAELPDHNRRELLKTSNIMKREDCAALDDIPALVGDTKPEMWLGRIGLVKDVKARKSKLYE